jgi:ERF superfamily protein
MSKATASPIPNGNGAATAVAVRPSRKSPNNHGLGEPQNPQQPQTLMQAIMMAASNPTVDTGKVRELVELHKTLQEREWQRAYNESMVACQTELQPVARNRTNDHTHSRYADLARLAEVALPIVHKHGFALTFGELEPRTPNHVGIAARISHRDGHTHTSEFHVPHELSGFKGTANKTAVHSWSSALTYCRRYSLLCAFNVIVAGDDDGNAAAGKSRTSKDERADMIAAGRLSPTRQQEDAVTALESAVLAVTTLDALEAVWDKGRHDIRSWPRTWRERMIALKDKRKAELADTLLQLERSAKQLNEQFDRERYQQAIEEDAAERRYQLNRPRY